MASIVRRVMSFPLNKANVYFLPSLIVLPLAGTYKKFLYILAIISLEIKKNCIIEDEWLSKQ